MVRFLLSRAFSDFFLSEQTFNENVSGSSAPLPADWVDGSWLWGASGTHIYSNTGMQLGVNFWKGALGLDLSDRSLGV